MEKKEILAILACCYRQACVCDNCKITLSTKIPVTCQMEFIRKVRTSFPNYRIDPKKLDGSSVIGDYVKLVLAQPLRKEKVTKDISAAVLRIANASGKTCVTGAPSDKPIFYEYQEFLEREFNAGRVSAHDKDLAYYLLCGKLFRKLCKHYHFEADYIALRDAVTPMGLMELFYRKNRF